MLALIPSAALLTLFYFFTRSSYKRSKGYRAWGLVFAAYISITLELVGFPSLQELGLMMSRDGTIFNPVLNYVPFGDGFNITDCLNLILFLPLGFILPTMWKKFEPFHKTLLLGFIIILVIEAAQMFTMNRATDINDLIMNTSGLIAGWLVHRFIFRNVSVSGDKEKSREWVLPLVLPLVFFFFL